VWGLLRHWLWRTGHPREEGRVFCEDFSMVGADTHVALHCFPVQVIYYYVTVGHVAFFPCENTQVASLLIV